MKQLPWLMLAALLLGGCSEPTGPKTVTNKDLSIKIPAFKTAVEQNDKSAIAEMVRELDDDDPAVRLYAIQGLQRLTGQDLGYRYYEDREARKPAVQKWNQWLGEQKH